MAESRLVADQLTMGSLMYTSALARIAASAVAAGLATSTFAAGVQIAPLRNQSETAQSFAAPATNAAMNPPIVNWSAPPYYNPPRGLFSSYPGAGTPITKSARTLATFVPVTPCRLVDTRGSNNPVYAGGPFATASAVETRVYQATGNCGIPAINSSILAVSVAVTTIPNASPGDVEVIPANVTPGATVLMVIAQNIWNSATTATGLDSTGKFQVQMRFGAPTPTHMALDVNGYYTSLDPSNVGDYFAVFGDVGLTGHGLARAMMSRARDMTSIC